MPIDPNILMQGAQLQIASRQLLGNDLSNAIRLYQEGRKKGGLDLEQLAAEGIYEQQATGKTTPERMAAIQALDILKGPKLVFDPTSGNVVESGSIMDRLQNAGPRQYKPSFPPLAQAPAQGMEAGIPSMDAAQLSQSMPRIPAQPPAALTPQQQEALRARGDVMNRPAMPLPQVSVPFGASPKTTQAVQEANVDLLKKQGEIPLEVQLAKEKEDARKRAEVAIKTETAKAETIAKDTEAIPLLQSMIEQNKGTLPIPYAGNVQGAAKIFAPEASKNFDLMQQNRLNLAAPLAKALGVNPTDKDFKATLDRIVDVNATQESREAQMRQLMRQIVKRNPVAAGLPEGTKEYGLYHGKMIYQLPDGTHQIEQ